MTRANSPHPTGRLTPLFALIPAGAIALLAGWATATLSWARVGVPVMSQPFGDLRQATFTAQCAQAPDWNMHSQNCDPFGRPYNLPPIWAKGFALLGVDQYSTELIGVIFVILFVLCIAAIAAMALTGRRPLVLVLVLTLAAVSPPVSFLLERGNVDAGVFFVVIVSTVLYFLRFRVASAVGIAFGVLLKLFPVGAALSLLIDRPRRKVVLLVFVALGAVDLVLLAPDLGLIWSRTQHGTIPAFGIGVLPLWLWPPPTPVLDLEPDISQATVIGLAVFAVTLVLAIVFLGVVSSPLSRAWSRLTVAIRDDRTSSILILVGGATFMFGYLATTSWDYRMVFLIPLIAGLARIGWRISRLAIPGAVLILVQMYLSYPAGQWQFASDFMWLALAPALTFLLIRVSFSLLRRPLDDGRETTATQSTATQSIGSERTASDPAEARASS